MPAMLRAEHLSSKIPCNTANSLILCSFDYMYIKINHGVALADLKSSLSGSHEQ